MLDSANAISIDIMFTSCHCNIYYIYNQQVDNTAMGKKTNNPHAQRAHDIQLQKQNQTIAKLEALQMALVQAITQNQALRERVIQLEALLVALQMKEDMRHLKDKRQDEQQAKTGKTKKGVQKCRNYK